MEYIVEEDPTLSNSSYTFIELSDEVATDSIVVLPSQFEQPAKDYICGSCDEAFAHRDELDVHLKAKHPQIFTVVSSYRKHEAQKVTAKEKNQVQIIKSYFVCKCGEKFGRFLELEQHVEIEHTEEFQKIDTAVDVTTTQQDVLSDLQYFDEEDPIEFRNDFEDEGQLEEETLLEEPSIEEDHLEEENEETSFVTIDELKRGSDTKYKTVRGVHACSYCSEKFNIKGKYLTHMREKHPDNPEFVCEICSKGFFDPQQLKKHKTTHNLKRFVCDICSKGFTTKSKLTTHLDVHFRRNTVDCEICGKKFAAKSGYRVHLKKHFGMWDKNLVCQICNARFRYQYNLDLHKKTHSGQKDFFCDICNKGFSLQRQLQAHLDSHNGLRRFGCDICGQKFIRRQTWRRHLLCHTGEKAYRCEICNAAYVDRRSLRKHLEKIHPNSNIEAFSKPLSSVPLIVEEGSITEIDSNLVYAEIQM